MSVSTGISRVTGALRTWAIAYAMGATVLSSSYWVANNIPNMIYELVAGGVLSSIFIPVYLERLRKHGEDDANGLVISAFNLALVVLGVVAILATYFAEPIVRIQLTRPDQVELGTYFFRFFAVQIVIYGAGAIMTGVLNSHRQFVAPAVGPIFNNVVVIVTLLGFYVPFRDSNPQLAITGLAIGTTLGVVAQMAVQVPPLIKLKMPYRPRIDLRHPALGHMGRKMVPVVFYVAVNLVGVTFRNRFASTTAGNGPAVLGFAWMFYQLPYGVFAVALATAIFPELSEYAAQRDWPAFRSQFSRGLRTNAALILPASAMLIALAVPLASIYHGGAGARFTSADVPIVAGVLAVWAAGLFSFTTYMFTVRGFYANQDSLTPMVTNTFATVVQVALYATLTFGVLRWQGIGLLGIPAGDAIAYTLHLIVLLYLLRRKVGGFDVRGLAWTVARVGVASVAGAAVAIVVVRLTPGLSGRSLLAILQVAIAGVPGIAVAYGLATLMRVSEMEAGRQMVARVLGRMFRGARP